jgi:rusticyanin
MNMRRVLNRKHGFIVAVSAALIGSSSTAQAAPSTGFKVAGVQSKSLSVAAAAAVDKTETPGLVSADRKTLTFRQKTVRLVVHSGPASDMLSYRIAGLRNPTLIVSAGTTLKALFINMDDDMTHNLRFTVQKPPFNGSVKSAGTANLSHKSMTAYHAEDLTMRMPTHAGTYTYLCTIPGHAPGGMYGTLIVR